MPPPAHDSDAESVLSHVSETSDEEEDGRPARAQGDTQAESPAPPLRTAALPLLPLTDPHPGASVSLPVPLKTLTPPPPLEAPAPPPPLTAPHAAAACASEVATALVALSAHAAACDIATAFLGHPPPAPASTGAQDVCMHPALSAAADAFCAPQGSESLGESVFDVQSFESITEARRGDAQTSADTILHASAATGARDACGAGDEKHEHKCAAGWHASAATGAHDACGAAGWHASAGDQTNRLTAIKHQAPEEAKLQAPEDKNTRNSFTQSMAAVPPPACVSEAPAPASASGTGAPRRRRWNELEALRPSAGATHKLLRGAAVTDPRIVGPMRSGCG